MHSIQEQAGRVGRHGGIAMVEAIEDQWVILAALAVLVTVVAWLWRRR